MKRIVMVLALSALLFAVTGCCGSLNAQFVKAVDSNWTVMGKDYRKYVEADESLPEASKKRRLATIDDFSLLVKEAKADVEK